MRDRRIVINGVERPPRQPRRERVPRQIEPRPGTTNDLIDLSYDDGPMVVRMPSGELVGFRNIRINVVIQSDPIDVTTFGDASRQYIDGPRTTRCTIEVIL